MLLEDEGQAKVALSLEEECFQRAYTSQTLKKAPAMRALLLYLWQHRSEDLSEYAVGVEALGRRQDFEPRVDATVRVQVSRLRQKLKEFYETEDKHPALRLTIPVGGHHLELVRSGEAPASPLPEARTVSKRWLVFAALPALAAIAVAAALWAENRQFRQLAPEARAGGNLPLFWKNFFAGGRPTSLILPTPIFFIWDERRLVVRDSHVNEYGQRDQSEYLRSFVARFGEPALWQEYTVAEDTVAAVKLAQYLERHGEHLWVSSAAQLPVDSFGDRNLIFVGSPGTSEHLQQLLERTNFYLTPGTTGIVRNRRVIPGESATYEEHRQSEKRRVIPGILSVLPGRATNTKLLLLSGRHPASLVSLLVSPGGLETLDQLWREKGRPDYFEAVVRAEVDGNTVLKANPVAFRKFSVSH